MSEPDQIQESLMEKLESCSLADRITFDDSALDELRKVSGGDLRHAEAYAGAAVLDALQDQRRTITAEEIERVNIIEMVPLLTGGGDPWDDVRYIGNQVPGMTPEGVQLRRNLSSWDANRNRDSMEALRDGRLPQYALSDRIQYEQDGVMGPEVLIPFRYDPSKNEIEAVAQSLANFVSEHAGQPQEVEDISSGRDLLGAQFMVRENNPQKDGLLVDRNYRVTKRPSSMEGAQSVVSITREALCRHGEETLRAYAQSINS